MTPYRTSLSRFSSQLLSLSSGFLFASCLWIGANRAPARTRATVAPQPTASSADARALLASVDARDLLHWSAEGSVLDRDLAAFEPVSFSVEVGRCYSVVVVLQAGSTWPRSAPLQLSIPQRSSSPLYARDASGDSGRWDAEHPVGSFTSVCAAASGTATIQPAEPTRATSSAAPARVIVAVRSRSLLDVAAAQAVPAGWPSSFSLMPGRVTSRSTSRTGNVTHSLLTLQTGETSMELVDWFFRQVSERDGFRLAEEREMVTGDTPMRSRVFRRANEVRTVLFHPVRMAGGQWGTITVMLSVDR